VPSATRWVVAGGGAGTRAARADRRDRAPTRPTWMPAYLRTNVHPETGGPKFVVAWKQLPLGVPPGHVPRCHVVAARAVATGGREDRSGGRSTRRRRTNPPAPRGEGHRSSIPRRASGRGNPHPHRAGDAETLERVLRSAERPEILDESSYPRPIVFNGCNHLPNFQGRPVPRGYAIHDKRVMAIGVSECYAKKLAIPVVHRCGFTGACAGGVCSFHRIRFAI
jgi:hypothetical protein